MKGPGRLLDDPVIPPALRADLEGAQRLKEPFDPAVGLSALQAAIERERVPPPPATRDSTRRLGAGMSAISVLAAALAAAAAVGLQQHSAVPPRSESKASPPPVQRAPRQTGPTTREVSLEPERPVSEKPVPKRGAATGAELQREVAQLGRIRELLDRDPGQALQLAQAGHREFRHGVLHEEREGLAVIALWRLGRAGEAPQRTRAFVARYPRSALREQIERLAREHRAGGRYR